MTGTVRHQKFVLCQSRRAKGSWTTHRADYTRDVEGPERDGNNSSCPCWSNFGNRYLNSLNWLEDCLSVAMQLVVSSPVCGSIAECLWIGSDALSDSVREVYFQSIVEKMWKPNSITYSWCKKSFNFLLWTRFFMFLLEQKIESIEQKIVRGRFNFLLWI